MVLCGLVWCDVVQSGVVWCDVVWAGGCVQGGAAQQQIMRTTDAECTALKTRVSQEMLSLGDVRLKRGVVVVCKTGVHSSEWRGTLAHSVWPSGNALMMCCSRDVLLKRCAPQVSGTKMLTTE